jgi:general stress protein 26
MRNTIDAVVVGFRRNRGKPNAIVSGNREQILEGTEIRDAMMLGLDGVEDGHARPMTAQIDGARSPIWFFTTKDNAIVENLVHGDRAIATFTSKNHDLFATIHGRLGLDDDRATIHRLWNRYVAAWYEGGKDDLKLALLRLDPDAAEIWLDASSLVAGLKLLLGADPKQEFRDKVAKVSLK